MQTKIHCYWFNIGNETEKTAYEEMRAKLESDGRNFFNVISLDKDRASGNGTGTIELETNSFFSNQWNTTADSPTHPNARVFDWYEEYMPQRTNQKIKSGHWLEITPEMEAIRKTTLVCGYCGKHVQNGAPGFCNACLDSPYLKESELNLLRLLPVAIHNPRREPLTEQEQAELLPAYVSRQTLGADSRAVKTLAATRKRIEDKFRKETRNAKTEHDGFIWLLDRGVNTENVIFYSHAGKFSFGWLRPLESAVKSKLLDLLCEFPFEYEFSSKGGRE